MNLHALDRRSYKICRLRIKEKKTFGEIAMIFNLTPSRVEQIYRAAVRRIELRQRGRTDSPEGCLSVRALHALQRVFDTIEVRRTDVLRALRNRRLHPAVIQNYGWKTHEEICQWAGVSPEQLAAAEIAREIKDPDDWTTGDEPPTKAQRSYLKTLCNEARETFDRNLTKAQASKRIEELERSTISNSQRSREWSRAMKSTPPTYLKAPLSDLQSGFAVVTFHQKLAPTRRPATILSQVTPMPLTRCLALRRPRK